MLRPDDGRQERPICTWLDRSSLRENVPPRQRLLQ